MDIGACVDGGTMLLRIHGEYCSVVAVIGAAVADVCFTKYCETQLAIKFIGSIIISALTFAAPWLWLSKSRDISRN